MSVTMVFLAVSWVGAAGFDQASSAVEMKPAAITLEAPPEVDTPRSCVLRWSKQKKMQAVRPVMIVRGRYDAAQPPHNPGPRDLERLRDFGAKVARRASQLNSGMNSGAVDRG